jgi:hypothetical protein
MAPAEDSEGLVKGTPADWPNQQTLLGGTCHQELIWPS